MERLMEEQAKLNAYKENKEKLMRQKQFSELVENMKNDVMEQQHLEMKWNNTYDIEKLDTVQEKMNPYSP
jgi:hypothetical protein